MWVKHTNSNQSTQMINFDRINSVSIKETTHGGRFFVCADFNNSAIILYMGTFAECEIYMGDVKECILAYSRTITVLDRI